MNLQWIYEEVAEQSALNPVISDVQQLIPQMVELEKILSAAQMGRIKMIKEEVKRLKDMDQCYSAFTLRIEELAQNFDTQGIINLIEQSVKTE